MKKTRIKDLKLATSISQLDYDTFHVYYLTPLLSLEFFFFNLIKEIIIVKFELQK